jgi:hypothetical protein
MGFFEKVEDRPTPKSVYNWRVYAIAAVAGSAAVMIGYDRYILNFYIVFKFHLLILSKQCLHWWNPGSPFIQIGIRI